MFQLYYNSYNIDYTYVYTVSNYNIKITNLWCFTLFISFVSDDPALWIINGDTINHIIEHGFKQNLQNPQFPKSKRIIPGKRSQFRKLSLSLFQRTLLNGESGNRGYLSYSVTTGSVYCVPCRLFGNQVPILKRDGQIGNILNELMIMKILMIIKNVLTMIEES